MDGSGRHDLRLPLVRPVRREKGRSFIASIVKPGSRKPLKVLLPMHLLPVNHFFFFNMTYSYKCGRTQRACLGAKDCRRWRYALGMLHFMPDPKKELREKEETETRATRGRPKWLYPCYKKPSHLLLFFFRQARSYMASLQWRFGSRNLFILLPCSHEELALMVWDVASVSILASL